MSENPWDDFKSPVASTPASTSIKSAESMPWEDFKPEIGGTESFVRGAANNFPLLPQAIAGAESLTGIGDEGGYSKNLADWNAKAAAAKEANPLTYGAGAVTGAVAPLAIPGVGGFLGANPVIGNALYGAASGISNTDIMKNPAEATKEAITGGLIGGATAGALKGVGKGLGKIGGAAVEGMGKVGNRLEANATAQALDLNPRAFNMLARRIGKSANPESIALDINKNINELFPNAIKLGDTAASKFENLKQAHDLASDTIGAVIESTSEKYGSKLPEVDGAIAELKNAASKYKGLQAEHEIQSAAVLNDTAQKLENLKSEGTLNFRNLSTIKQEVGSLYNNPNYVTHGVDQTYSILSKTTDDILNRVGVDNPTFKPDFDRAKKVFKFTSDLLPAMQKGVTREVAGKGGGLANIGLGLLGFAHPAAWLALIGKVGTKLAYPELGPNIAYKTINTLRNAPQAVPEAIKSIGSRIPSAINQELTDFLTSKYKKGRK